MARQGGEGEEIQVGDIVEYRIKLTAPGMFTPEHEGNIGVVWGFAKNGRTHRHVHLNWIVANPGVQYDPDAVPQELSLAFLDNLRILVKANERE